MNKQVQSVSKKILELCEQQWRIAAELPTVELHDITHIAGDFATDKDSSVRMAAEIVKSACLAEIDARSK